MPYVCAGSGMYPTLVEEQFVQLDDRGNVLARLNDLAAEQLSHAEKRLFGTCQECRGDGYEITNEGTVRFHHRFTDPQLARVLRRQRAWQGRPAAEEPVLEADVARVLAHIQARQRSHPESPATGLHDLPDERWRACVAVLRTAGYPIAATMVAGGDRANTETGYILTTNDHQTG